MFQINGTQHLRGFSAATLPVDSFSTTFQKIAALAALCTLHREPLANALKPRSYGSLAGVKKLPEDLLKSRGLDSLSKDRITAACQLREASVTEHPDLCRDGINFHRYKTPLLTLDRDSRFHGFRILQLSDIHLKNDPWMANRLRSIARIIPDLEIDLVAITGDLADSKASDICENSLHALTKIAELVPQVYFVPGNHDYYAGIDAVLERVSSANIVPLVNKQVTLGIGDDILQIIGLDDVYSEVTRNPTFFNESSIAKFSLVRDKPTIVLTHSIDSLCDADEPLVDLVLSGHTHGLIFKGFNAGSLWLEHHFGQKLLFHHNQQTSGHKAFGGRTLSFISNGLVDRVRHGFTKRNPIVQPAEALILELTAA